jgi:excisionase family DNA binding protein
MQDHICNECQHPHQLVIQPQLHDVDSACRLLSISRSTFYVLVREGRIPVYKLGAKTLVTSIAIQHFVQAAHEGSVTGQSDSDGGDS